jgi:DnaJ domain
LTQLFGPVCSITTTKRRRFFWAAWWTAPPRRAPFVKPDASDGGAATFEEALAAAEKRAGTSLRVIEPLWARAWIRVLRGQHPWPNGSWSAEPPPRTAGAQPAPTPTPQAQGSAESIWVTLGVSPDVSAEDLKLAFRRRALETHPDQGGDPDTFRRVLRAYAEAQRRIRRPQRRAR